MNVMKIVVFATLVWCGAAAVSHGDIQQIKQQMANRLPSIDALKQQGTLGEGRNGLLEIRGSHPDAQPLVSAENADRLKVYEAIALQQNVSPETVGQLRARQIAEKAAPGVWVQAADGSWTRK